MRRSLLLLGPIALTAFVFACEDDPSNASNPNLPEAGSFDANQPSPPDGALPDASPDVDAAPPTTVTVIVANRKGPRPGVTVVFHDATGAVLETKTTDAMGRATSNAAGPIPKMASALLGQGTNQREILTWTEVEAGDELAAAEAEPSEELGIWNIAIPSAFDDAGVTAAAYRAFAGGCSAGPAQAPLAMTVYSDCAGPQNAPLVAAIDEGDAVLGYAFKKNVAPPGGGATVDVNALTGWVMPATFTVTVQNPPGVAPLTADLLEIASGVATANDTAFFFDDANQSKFRVAPGYAEAYQASVRYRTQRTTRRLATRYASTATEATFDFQQALPEMTDVTVDSTDKKRPSLSWTASSSLAGTDGGFVRATMFFPNESQTRWTIVVPPGGTTGTVKAPVLPATEAATFLPDPDASPNAAWFEEHAVFAEADALADYKAFKRFQGLVNQAEGTPAGYLPQNGSYRTTEIEPPPSF